MAFAGEFPPKKGAEFLLIFPIYDADGDLVSGAVALDSEVSKDNGAFSDCINEASEIGASGIYALTLTADEMDADVIAIITKTTTADAKTTPTVIYTSSAQISDLSTLGVGAIAWTYTLTEEGTGIPIADADVWATTDPGGANVKASGQTNQDGQITFFLDSGIIYIWRAKTGWNFSPQPDVEIVS